MTDQQTSPADPQSDLVTSNPPTASAAPPPRAQRSAIAARRATATTWVRRRRRRVVVGSTVVVFVGFILVSTGGKGSPILSFLPGTPDSSAGSPAEVVPATGTIGESVRDGSFAFVVTSAKPPVKTVRDRFGDVKIAEGEFVIVGVNVTNIGFEPRTLGATEQFLANVHGQRFATSSATSSLKGIPHEKLNPGHTANDVPLLFDLPPGTAVTSIELHDSLSSTGVKVKL